MRTKFENDLELEHLIETLDRAEERHIFDADNKKIDGYVAIWNMTKNQIENVVEDKYNVIEHRQAFIPAVRALRSKNIPIEGTIKNHSGTAILEVRFKNVLSKDDSKDGIVLGMRLMNSYNHYSRLQLSGSTFGYRIVCANGMVGLGFTGAFRIPHTKVADVEKIVADFAGRVLDSQDDVEKQINEAISDEVSLSDALEILAAKMGGKKRTIEVLRLFKDNEANRWQLYNALTNYATHKCKTEGEFEFLQSVANKILVSSSDSLERSTSKIKVEVV